MLSISDDDSPKGGIPKQDTSKASSDDTVDPAVKPNFVYIVSINVAQKLTDAVAVGGLESNYLIKEQKSSFDRGPWLFECDK
jgi:hypothetical protein